MLFVCTPYNIQIAIYSRMSITTLPAQIHTILKLTSNPRLFIILRYFFTKKLITITYQSTLIVSGCIDDSFEVDCIIFKNFIFRKNLNVKLYKSNT